METADIALKDPSVKAGYVFQGWFDGAGNKVTHIQKGTVGNVTLTARYSYAGYTVTLDHQDATTIGASAVYVRYKTGIYASGNFTSPITSITVPAKTGYTFLGYYESVTDNDSPSVSGTNQRIDASGKILFGNTTYTGDVTLVAAWKPNTYTVVYNANGGTGSMSNSTHTYGVSSALTTSKFTRSGYAFIGWSTSSSATTPQYANGASVKHLASGGNVTLYAVWLKTSTTLVFEGEGVRDVKLTQGATAGEVVYPELNRELLKAYGYKNIKLTVTFDCKRTNLICYNEARVQVFSYLDVCLYDNEYDDVFSRSWESKTFTTTFSLDNVQTDGSFWMLWSTPSDGNGSSDGWWLGRTYYTIEVIG